jgi:hypothetical protein
MRGDTVIVRDYKGRPGVRRVWEADQNIVFVCSEERFKRLANNEDEWPATGLPREDVFCYDPILAHRLLDDWQDNQSIWDQLAKWPGN